MGFLTTPPVAPITTSDGSMVNRIQVRRSWRKVRQFSGMEGLRINMKMTGKLIGIGIGTFRHFHVLIHEIVACVVFSA
jgi:hypothetical protein